MDAYTSILTRRSIRKYKDQPILEDSLEKILKAAAYAPSAMNLQPWHFIVLNKREILDNVLTAIPYAEFIKSASAAILVCGDSKTEKNESWMLQNCSAVTQNILLAAHSLNLGSCWIGIHGVDEIVNNVSKLFALPPHIIPVSMVSLGIRDEEVQTEERYKKELIHYNKW